MKPTSVAPRGDRERAVFAGHARSAEAGIAATAAWRSTTAKPAASEKP